MLLRFRYPIRSHSILTPFRNNPRTRHPKTQIITLEMVTKSTTSKRPTCPSCSKPIRLCLCARLKTPALENTVSVTILQHSLEKKHPLNSARIATLGLKNVSVVWVSDVLSETQFDIHLLEDNDEVGSFDSDSERDQNDSDSKYMQPNIQNGEDGSDSAVPEECDLGVVLAPKMDEDMVNIRSPVPDGVESLPVGVNQPDITFTIKEKGAIGTVKHCSMLGSECQKPSFDQLLASPVALDAWKKGFAVRKWQKRYSNGSIGCDDFQEFELAVPPGTVLLFPSEKSVGIEAMNFEVNNLIVLDGTWSKAKRMYVENPWLKLLPHLKLDLDKPSLYSEVRQQPRSGYLSTIESIVYALKALGDSSQGLDGLLDVFESMVVDQRRCKDERLSKASLM